MGPVQMLVIGFEGGEFRGEIAAELERLREDDTIRVLDLVIVAKDADGNVSAAEGEEGLALRLLDVTDADLAHLEDADAADLWEATEAIPPGAAAAVALIEHRWAIPLRDAIANAGGVPLADAWLAPEDVASLGLPA
jgi:Family of unknown function (DUF6325)